MEMSVVGDTVNVASRIERLTRTLDCGAVATGKTIDAAGGPPPGWRDVGRHRLPGRAADVQVWARDFDADDPERNVFETL